MEFIHTFLSFVVALGVLITFHEFGHFWVARRLGVRVLKFSVGFGKPLWCYQKDPDSTEFVVAAIPGKLYCWPTKKPWLCRVIYY